MRAGLAAASTAIAVLGAGFLTGCGGPGAQQVRSEVASACAAHGRAMPASRGTVVFADHLLLALSAFNATDAALDAVGARGDDGRAVDRLRNGLLAARAGFAAAYHAAATGDLRPLVAAGSGADAGYADVDAAAASLGVAACSADRMGRPLLRHTIAALQEAERRAGHTGDYRTDARRACRGLPASRTLARTDPADPRSLQVALRMNERLQAIRTALAAITPPRREARAHRAVLRALDDLDDLLASYVEAVGVSDATGAAQVATQVSGVLVGVRQRLFSVGVRC